MRLLFLVLLERREAALRLTDRALLGRLSEDESSYVWTQALATRLNLHEPVQERILQNLPAMLPALKSVRSTDLLRFVARDLEALLPAEASLDLTFPTSSISG